MTRLEAFGFSAVTFALMTAVGLLGGLLLVEVGVHAYAVPAGTVLGALVGLWLAIDIYREDMPACAPIVAPRASEALAPQFHCADTAQRMTAQALAYFPGVQFADDLPAFRFAVPTTEEI